MMKISLVTNIFARMPFDELTATAAGLGIEALELGTGNWSANDHLKLDALLGSATERDKFKDTLKRHNLEIAAFNCSGNPLKPGPDGEAHKEVMVKTLRLAELFGVKTVVAMSGCPGGGPKDSTVNWITHPILPEHQESLDWQWDEMLIPFWQEMSKRAEGHGVERLAIENLGMNLVYNADTLLRLRAAVGPRVGMNLDPSHHMWMGGDPIAMARKLGDAILHVHAKDVRIERVFADADGLIDTHWIADVRKRQWNYVALGHAHDLAWWKEFFSVLVYLGYDGPVSLEMEDLSMAPIVGVKKSLDVLRQALPRDL